jgi:hypothetical protein
VSRPGAYTSEQKTLRRALLAVYAPTDPCWRCGRPLGPDPSLIDLGHRDDRSGYAGLEHSKCNREAGARLGNRRRRAAEYRRIAMATMLLGEVALACEISEDRMHCALVAAGRLDHGMILVELAAYLPGADPVGAVLALRGERKVCATVIDPHSHAATAIAPLEQAGVKITRPSSSDLVVAHGGFLDALRAGRIRHHGQAELTTAMRVLEQRRLGGATAPDRRGGGVDVSPAVAAELACWGLELAPKVPPPDIF